MDLPVTRLAVVGGKEVGKTSITKEYARDGRPAGNAALGLDSFTKQVTISGKPANLDILDAPTWTEGQKDLRDACVQFSQGFLLVFDVTSRASFDELSGIHEQILDVKQRRRVPMVLVANKCDITGREREVAKLDGEALARTWDIEYFEVSAKTPQNVDEAFEELVREVRREMKSKPMSDMEEDFHDPVQIKRSKPSSKAASMSKCTIS